MRPHILTTDAVIMVEKTMTAARSFPTGMPRDFASSSGRDNAFIFQRKSHSPTAPTTMKGSPIERTAGVAPVKDPIQKVMEGRTSWGSAVYFTRLMRAEKRAAITSPDKMSISTDVRPLTRLTKKTSATAASPAASDIIWTAGAGTPRRIPRTAPKAAPVATPRVSGVARGFANKA